MGRAQCRYCGRKFNEDRIGKHESACAVASKKRPVFNIKKQRVSAWEFTIDRRGGEVLGKADARGKSPSASIEQLAVEAPGIHVGNQGSSPNQGRSRERRRYQEHTGGSLTES